MNTFIRSRLLSFQHAFAGWWFVIRTQKNAWIHAMVSVVVVGMCFWLDIDTLQWALIIVAIAMVWTSEFINTALEAVVDLASQHEYHVLARVGKDVGAAAVLIAAFCSILIGLLVLGPPLWERILTIVR
jgi:diacylglycerol kinase (ATP)